LEGETQPQGRSLRVLIVGEDPLARSGLSSLLSAERSLEILGQTASPDEIPLSKSTSNPDVLLWDLGQDGRSSLERLRAFPDPDLPILVLCADESSAVDALSAGVKGVVVRDVGAGALAAALQAVSRGMVVLDEHLAAAALRPRISAAPPAERLTARELEVLQLLAQGLSNKLIGDRLGITEHTAKFHVNSIIGKLGAQTRTEAVVQAVRVGLVLL
jgi:two-component system nitrate/nitrite response regulator NarL